MEKRFSVFVSTIFLLILFSSAYGLEGKQIGDGTLMVQGYINQSVAYGLSGNQYDTKRGFQSFLTQALIEARYDKGNDLSFFLSGKFNADWAYPAFSDNKEWREKRFNHARDNLFIYDKPRDYISEAHVTWKKGDFYLRAGKQIVAWGETDGFRLMDQINPIDQRRGISDVEFETSIIPIWLLRAEYKFPVVPSWIQDCSVQFIFNPNADFAKNKSIVPGNDLYGIWAPNVIASVGGPYPFDYAHIGQFDANYSEPGSFDNQGFAYGLRIATIINDARISLNGYYGRDHDPLRTLTGAPRIETSDWDSRMILHMPVEGYYPYFRFVGATYSKDIDSLRSSALGGVAPVLRLEGFYAFNNTFTDTGLTRYITTDEIRWMAGADWKVKIPILNDKAYFLISPQIYNRRIANYPTDARLQDTNDLVRENTWTTTLMINTTYFHNKLQPSFFWLKDWSSRSGFIRPQLTYEHSNVWKFSLGAVIVQGEKEGHGYEPLNHKDHVYSTISYRF